MSTSKSCIELTDSHFSGKNVNFRAVAALLVGGIYYTVFHLDLNTTKVKDDILAAISQIVS